MALVAKASGYEGAIAGWQRVGNYRYWGRVDDAWWPVSTAAEAEARIMYIAKAESEVVAVRDLWPSFPVLTTPDSGPIGVLVSFATALALKTEGAIAAKVVPVPKEDDQRPQLYDFVLYAAANPRTRSVLFSAYEKDPQTLVVVDWEDAEIVVDTERGLESMLADIAQAAETRSRIERLALAADAENI